MKIGMKKLIGLFTVFAVFLMVASGCQYATIG